MELIHKSAAIGGLELNFIIKGGPVQPDAPKENTIWIETDTAIGQWQFSATQPEARTDGTSLQDGDVWVETSATSATSVNVVKKNGIFIKLGQAYQHMNGEWQKKNGKIYQNTAWKDIFSFVTVMDTSENAAINVWKMASYNNNSSEVYGTVTSTGGINFTVNNNYGRCTEQTERDFSGYTMLEIYVSKRSTVSNNLGETYFGVINDKNASVGAYGSGMTTCTQITGTGTFRLDLSDCNQLGYLALYQATGGNIGITKIKLYK